MIRTRSAIVFSSSFRSSAEDCVTLGKQLAQDGAMAAMLVGAIASDEDAPVFFALGRLSELAQLLARRERGQPDVVVVARRERGLRHAAGRPPHRADAQSFAGEAGASELNNVNRHGDLI